LKYAVLKGGKEKKLLSHCNAYIQIPAPVASRLPRILDFNTVFKVVFAGKLTPNQIVASRKRYDIRKNVIEE
jgi:hypothetical protein